MEADYYLKKPWLDIPMRRVRTRGSFVNSEPTRVRVLAGLHSRFHYIDNKLSTVIGLPSLFCKLNKKVLTVTLLGILLLAPVVGASDLVFNRSLDKEIVDSDNTIFRDVGRFPGRMLVATNNDKRVEAAVNNSDMIIVHLRRKTEVAEDAGMHKHQSYQNSIEIPAVLYVLRNGKNVKISCNLIADEKALAYWISNGNSKETTEMHDGTDKLALPVHKELKTRVVVAIASVIFVMLWLCCAAGFLLWFMCWKGAEQNEVAQEDPIFQLELCGEVGPRRFRYHELVAATDNFADEKKLGQGGFGSVYRGYLRNQDRYVAIKVLSRESSGQGLEEFQAEVKVMTRLRHRNIVPLVGWCDSPQGLLLVYELMAQGSLDKHLYDPEKKLTWEQRYSIILGLGSGLLYLHQDCEKCIVHGDIKPANVMIDASYNAKLGDFGQARLIEHGVEPQTTEIVAGTRGYIDPEFINNRLRCPETDIYSFGVALLEIACGKRPTLRQPNGASALLAWVRDLYDRTKILDAADKRLRGEFDQQQMERVLVTGLWCAHPDPSQRPMIAQAMDILRSADAGRLPVLPATRDAQHIRSMEELAYDNLPVEDPSADAVSGTACFHTCKDSAYLLAEE
ncbi:unnamed protein product [Urochloa humidicola]